ncbi:hypothetical protein LJ753_10000 [Arthrobacter sp. zg-Y20]|uniref:hypothetical protein n=1 Tax=unclassified Arthrobacter TaxID=235627 RepID=UPI001D14E3D9|nr:MULTISPECIES: hypothetical protein [unclassified Arthrobacter]MCC3276201.1 hypothetical protein [Arthrobacter sp. zg-Y20]MDK1316361.1 hypothetical protein [Arthrobacter sp. zg.Y20]
MDIGQDHGAVTDVEPDPGSIAQCVCRIRWMVPASVMNSILTYKINNLWWKHGADEASAQGE